MPIAIALIIAGFTMVYSALKGLSLTEIFSGTDGEKLDAKGGSQFKGNTGPDQIYSPAGPGQGDDPKGVFKGPNAKLLRFLADVAEDRYNLRITQICRPQNATYGAPNSKHKQCRAFDAVGTVADRVAFARYAAGYKGSGIEEVFCDQANMVAPGYPHGDHIHVGG